MFADAGLPRPRGCTRGNRDPFSVGADESPGLGGCTRADELSARWEPGKRTDKGRRASAGTCERLSLTDPDPPVRETAVCMGLSRSGASLRASVPSQ